MVAKKAALRTTNRAKAAGRTSKKQDASKAAPRGAIPTPDALTKRSTKKDIVLSLLSRKNGASLGELAKATEWQAHSIRGFLSGTVSKKLGHTLSSKSDAAGTRRYAIKR